ncbi:MAG: ROK family protein [Lachnospiraceae bacterium]|nr:ROK family protein [Lachnospiraceae bacterium]
MSYRIGVDLGGTNMAAGMLDASYQIVKFATIKTRQGGTPEEIADDMAALVWNLAEDAGITKEEIELIGIGVPGSVTEEGVVEDANNINFYDVPFGAMMRERTGITIHMVNDARAAALGEYVAGAGKGSETFQMLTIGTGVGGALIVDGKVIAGCNGAAGEIGHMVIKQNGAKCNCGRRGCLEAYASAGALKEKMQRAVLEERKKWPRRKESVLWELCGHRVEYLNGKTLFKALEQEDELAQELFDEYIEYLAEGIANIINALQPEVFCIGGGMSEQKEKLLAPLRTSVMDKIYTKHSRIQTRIVAAELGNNAGIIGAAYK